MKDLLAKAETLTEALPWIKQTWGSTVVIKYGGAAMTDPALREQVAERHRAHEARRDEPGHRARRRPRDHQLHGAPRHAGRVLRRSSGDHADEAMEVVKMVLVGKVNKELVSAINAHGRCAVGLSGDDGNLVQATQRDPRLGRVGEVTGIDTTVLDNLDRGRLHPGRRDGRGRRGRRQLQRQRRPRRRRARGRARRGQGHLPHRRRRPVRGLRRTRTRSSARSLPTRPRR